MMEFIKELSKIISDMDTVFTNGIMDNSFKDSGRWVLKMGLEFGNLLTVVHIKENGL